MFPALRAAAAAGVLVFSLCPPSGAQSPSRDELPADRLDRLRAICDANAKADAIAQQPAEPMGCDVNLVVSGDHAYVYSSEIEEENCTGPQERNDEWATSAGADPKIKFLDGAVVPKLPPAVIQGWVSADGPLASDEIETITFCGFALENILLLDWSATTARLRFDLVEIAESDGPPRGTVASRGVFEGGLTITRSVIDNDVDVRDSTFGSYIELEKNIIRGAISVTNSHISGAVRVRNNYFQSWLRFEGVEIGGDTLVSGNSFPSAINEEDDAKAGENAAKEPRPEVEFDGSSPSVVRLRETRLGGILNINKNEFRDTVGNAQRSLYIQKSIISNNDLTIYDNVFTGAVFITDVEANKLTIASNDFDHLLSVTSNQFYSARTFRNYLYSSLKISANDIQSTLNLIGDNMSENTIFLEMSANQVGREISVSPFSWPKPGISVDFSFNITGGSFNVFWPVKNQLKGQTLDCENFNDKAPALAGPVGVTIPNQADLWKNAEPVPWNGEMAFVGSSVEGSLWLADSCSGRRGSMLPLDGIMALHKYNLKAYPHVDKAQLIDVDGDLRTPRSDRCDPMNSFILDFKEVNAGFLRLGVPPVDPYCWRGKGLSFEYFGKPIQGGREKVFESNGVDKVSGGIEDVEIQSLYRWLGRQEIEDPEVYFAAAEYLRDRGYLDQSRSWLERGRRVEFGLEKCDEIWDCVLPMFRHVFFFPSGYNTSPERAAFFVISLWLLMALVYWGYHRLCSGQRGSSIILQPDGASSADTPDEIAKAALSRRQPIDYDTKVEGFVAHEPEYAYRSFSLLGYSLDVTLPLVSLGLYRTYTPTSSVIRGVTLVHHIVGFWFVTAFLSASFF